MELVILYGGVTGNSQSIASLIASQAEDKEHLFNCVSLQSMSDTFIFNGERLSEALHTVSVIVTSTTGDGEVPEEAQPFLTNICSKSNIKNFRFALLGLGDSNYSFFCQG